MPVDLIDTVSESPACQTAAPTAPLVSMIGTRAMLFEAPGAFTMALQRRIWALVEEASGWPGVEEAVAGVTNLTLHFAEPPEAPSVVGDRLIASWKTLPERHILGRMFEIAVRYGGALGSDLPAVAAYAGLSPREVIAIHQAGEYTVCALGSSPGFGYLHGLDPRIFMPRKSVPSLSMQAGTVTIGGMQAGISVLTGPNGWNSIGFTDLAMFDAARQPPALFSLGDRIRFRAESIEA